MQFNEHFLKNSLALDDENYNYTKYLNNFPRFSMYLAPTNKTEVEKVLNILKSNTPGYDDVSPNILKYTSSVISTPLTHIINLSIKTGVFSNQLKKAKVIPLFKSGDRGDFNNCRPISILPAFNKIFENIISSRLINYFEKNNLLTEHQHGFRAQHSTETAILQFVNNVYTCLEEKLYIISVFMYFSKAFDTLDHNILHHNRKFRNKRCAIEIISKLSQL